MDTRMDGWMGVMVYLDRWKKRSNTWLHSALGFLYYFDPRFTFFFIFLLKPPLGGHDTVNAHFCAIHVVATNRPWSDQTHHVHFSCIHYLSLSKCRVFTVSLAFKAQDFRLPKV